MKKINLVTALFPAFFAVSCGSPIAYQKSKPEIGSRGLHASEHRQLANYHSDAANQQRVMSDRRSNGIDNGMPSPWYRSWGSDEDHEQMAQFHRAEVKAINAQYTSACGSISDVNAAVSPLAKFGMGGWATQSGAIVYLSPDSGTPEQLMQAIACHRAWMMLAPANMENCPLDLPGLQFDVRGDGESITLSLTVADRALVPELQRRVASEMR
jgi:hypothetical protein